MFVKSVSVEDNYKASPMLAQATKLHLRLQS